MSEQQKGDRDKAVAKMKDRRYIRITWICNDIFYIEHIIHLRFN